MQLTATPSTGLEKTGKDTLCNPARSHGNLRTATFKLALLSPCQHCCVFMSKHKRSTNDKHVNENWEFIDN